MPTPELIRATLVMIANDFWYAAVAWHAAGAAILIAAWMGWRPSVRVAAMLMLSPLLSVSTFSWLGGNRFNGLTFAALAGGLAIVALRMPRHRMVGRARWAVVAGALLAVFGWVYPHFFAARSALQYLYAAPAGLVPCPTLSALIGLTLIANGLESRAWCMLLGTAGLFYGVVGALYLRVWVDVALILGAVALMVSARNACAPTADLASDAMLARADLRAKFQRRHWPAS